MNRRPAARSRSALSLALWPLLLAGCSTLDSLNPFSSAPSGPKMAELKPLKASLDTRIAWRESVGKTDDFAFSPAVLGNSLYAAGKDGSVLRLDDGRAVWRIKAELPLSAGVAADGKLVVVGTAKGDLLAYAAEDGKFLWKARASSEILAVPAIGEGLVVVRSGDNRLAAYDAADGKRKWIYQRPTPALTLRVTAAPVISGQYVFAGYPGGKLVALSTTNGAPLWEGAVALPKGATELDRVADIASEPVIDGRDVCAVAFQGRVACFDLGNGNLTWARELSSSTGLAIAGRHVYVSDEKGAVHALDRASGASLWKQDELFMRRLTAPLVQRGAVAVADVQGVVHFLSREDGALVGRIATDGSPVAAVPRTLGSGLVVQTRNGGVFAIETQ